MRHEPHISAFTVIVVFAAVSLIGLALIPSLSVKLEPTRALPQLTIRFNMQGSAARIVEMDATSKLEAMLSRIEGVKNINSLSDNNSATITLELDKHSSMDMARFEASTIIRQTWSSLPASVSYPIITVDMPDEETSRPFLVYNIDATVSPILIQQYAEEHIKPQLAQIPGIYEVDVTGATPMEWLLEYDIAQLDAMGVSVEEISKAVNLYNEKESLGMVLDNNQTNKHYIRLSISSLVEKEGKGFHAENIYVKGNGGKLIRLDQLVKVTYREQPPMSYYRINGLNSVYISIIATKEANQLRLSKAIKNELELLRLMLPKGYEMHIDYDATEHINIELNKIYIRTAMTILILLMFVYFVTFSTRYLLLIVLSLFFNISVSLIFYYLFRLEIQLYSLAGITISLSLIIDNTIIMADHFIRNRNRKAFLSMLAATLTTVGALAMIFFLDEKLRLNLQDFAAVVMINLIVSLSVALLFVPAAIEKMKVKKEPLKINFKKLHYKPKRTVVHFSRFYYVMIGLLVRFRSLAFILLLLAFGLPIFMLPDRIETGGKFAELYNKIMTQNFRDNVRPILDKSLGGTLRLFVQKVYNGSYFKRNNEKTLIITASMPNGTTMEQMNHLVQQMEIFLTSAKGIRQFQANIMSPLEANVTVLFTKEAERTGLPYELKNKVVSKALQLGGGSWSVYGLEDNAFSNNVRESAGDMMVQLFGYNYDDLYAYADTLRERLETYRRVKGVTISSHFSWYKDDYNEYVFKPNLQRLAVEDIKPYELYASISPVFGRDIYCGYVNGDNQTENIKLSSAQSCSYDLWSLSNLNRTVNARNFKMSDVATIDKTQAPQSIAKENQQYVLCLQYEYIGAPSVANKVLNSELKKLNEQLPMGYTAKNAGNSDWWNHENNAKQYIFLSLIILIIFFITAILFNSLKQPLAIIFVIPISYIGVFLTFYLFELNFDQGGFASFVLLCGITVNASIYLLDEYNNIHQRKPLISPINAYIKAWNIKIIPIFLTVISTILGFLPFMFGLDKESFWFPLSAGTIGGLVMSLVGIFIFLPIFVIGRKTLMKLRHKKLKLSK